MCLSDSGCLENSLVRKPGREARGGPSPDLSGVVAVRVMLRQDKGELW